MIATPISFDGRALRRTLLALAGAALLTACDTSRSLEPTTVTTPTNANLARFGSASSGGLLISMADQNGAAITTLAAAFSVTIEGGRTLFVVDNGAIDSLANIGGVLVLNIKPGRYTICQTAAPAGYVMALLPECITIDVPPGSNTHGKATSVQFKYIKPAA